MKKKLFLPLILFLFLLTGCSSAKIELSQYADIKISGYNGYGFADVNVNWSALEAEFTKNDKQDSVTVFAKLMSLESSIEYSVDKKENLSNGDIVNLTVKWNKDIAKKHKLSFTTKKLSVKVEKLEEPKKLDLFTDLHIEYEGISPKASAILRNASSDPFIKNISYYIKDNIPFNISNGDKIIVEAKITKEDALKKGYIIETTEKEITVDGIDEYITKYESIDNDTLEKMKKQAIDLIESNIASVYDYMITLYPDVFFGLDSFQDSINIIENNLKHAYFFSLKPGIDESFGTVNNSIFLVYKIKFTTSHTKIGTEDVVYLPVYFKDIVKRSDGKIDVNIVEAMITKAKSSNFDNLYRDIVTVNKAKYDYEEINY